MIEVMEINNSEGVVANAAWLLNAQDVHRQLRPNLSVDYVGHMKRVFEGGGRMAIAVIGDEVVGVAVYRIYENTALGLHMYVDDLVTSEKHRSRGVGQRLLGYLQELAKGRGCGVLTLDSANHRKEAHRFYIREEFSIIASHFAKYFRE